MRTPLSFLDDILEILFLYDLHFFGGMTPEDTLAVETHGDAYVLFTAPHGVYVRRETAELDFASGGKVFATHVPEKWTTFLALAFASEASGTSMTWTETERERSKTTRTFNPHSVDPNCVAYDTINNYNWGAALRLFGEESEGEGNKVTDGFETKTKQKWLHVDVHGRRDPNVSHESLGRGDVDIGTHALSARYPELAHKLTKAVGLRLRWVFDEWADDDDEDTSTIEDEEKTSKNNFRVNESPILRGARHDGFLTLAQQGVTFGLVSIQLELSLSLRLVLKNDISKAKQFAHALVEAWKETKLRA
jgi:hypothetical protein